MRGLDLPEGANVPSGRLAEEDYGKEGELERERNVRGGASRWDVSLLQDGRLLFSARRSNSDKEVPISVPAMAILIFSQLTHPENLFKK